MRKRRLAFLSALALAFCLLCGCGGEDPAADDPLAAYDGTWYFAKNGMACEFGEGNIYREDESSMAGQTLTGIYSDAGDHLEANLAGVGGVDQLRKLYIVDSDQGEILCDSADGKGTIYFYREPLAVLTALEAAEATPSAEPTPVEPTPTDEAPLEQDPTISPAESPEVVPLEPLDDAASTSPPSDTSGSPPSKAITTDPEPEPKPVPTPKPEPTPEPQPTVPTEKTSGTVWIPQSGTKYHSTPSCSGMKDPTQVSLSEAQSQGYTPCKRCH